MIRFCVCLILATRLAQPATSCCRDNQFTVGTWGVHGVYEGDFIDGSRHGRGRETTDGTDESGELVRQEVYEGDFVDGRRDGEGGSCRTELGRSTVLAESAAFSVGAERRARAAPRGPSRVLSTKPSAKPPRTRVRVRSV